MTQEESTSKLHVDTDWKAEARAEKERLAKEEEAKAERSEPPRAGELPKADFKALVGMLASQAILGLGAMGDPKSGRVVVDLPGARFSIDLLTMLEQRTKGNLTDEEVKELSQILAELRGRFVQISQLVAQQPAVAPEAAAAATAGGGLQTPPPSPP
ncbi:MAG: DUF1844 domain-containing protein [Planctomycetota bacterium]|nr:DUF1844 domain-containing protein [Planctomycetota bacterium]